MIKAESSLDDNLILSEEQGKKGGRLCSRLLLFYEEVKDFGKKAVEMGKSDPRKVIFAMKMGLALSLVSLLILWEQSFDDVGQYSIWAILTVIVMFEYTIGATFIKGINRGFGTFCAAILALFFAELSLLAGRWEKAVIIFSFFVTAFFASYLRLYPTMAPYDYGYRVFVLTYCILMIAGNRTREYIFAILTRLVLIAFGALTCFIVNISIFPIWSGEDLHRLIVKNFKDLATSLQGCVMGYLKGIDYERIPSKIFTYQEASDDPFYKGYRSVLESATREQTLLGFAVWEPPHGRYRMLNYPWRSFVRLSGALRHCAFMVMALHGCIMSEIQAPIEKRQVFRNEVERVSEEGAKVLHEIGNKLEKMEKLCNEEDILKQVHEAAQQLQRLIDQRSYLFVNSECWEIEQKPVLEKMEDLENSSENLQNRETVINIKSEENTTPSWPLPVVVDGEDGIIREDEYKTYETASSLSLATFASLLIEFVARLQNVVDTFQELSERAQFAGHC